MRKQRMTLIQAYEKTPTNSGIIYALFTFLVSSQIEVEWLSNEDVARAIDNYYYYFWSGDKLISPAVEKLMAIEGFDWKRQIMLDFWQVHKGQLAKLWDDFSAEYEAANNYNVTEIVEYDHTGDSTVTDSGTDTRTRSGVIQNYGKTTTTNYANTYDSQEAETGHNVSESKLGDDPATTRYGDGTNGLADSTLYGKTRTGDESGHDDLTTTKTGNLGITPIAQLLQMDIELWMMNFYKNVLFKFLDSALTLPIY